jgi:hypothetical protein
VTDAEPFTWSDLTEEAAVGLPYYAQHGSPSGPHLCIVAEPHLEAHRCRCGRRVRVQA